MAVGGASLEQLRGRAKRLSAKRARVLAVIAEEEREPLTRKSLEELLRLVEAARIEAKQAYRWRSRRELVLCIEEDS